MHAMSTYDVTVYAGIIKKKHEKEVQALKVSIVLTHSVL